MLKQNAVLTTWTGSPADGFRAFCESLRRVAPEAMLVVFTRTQDRRHLIEFLNAAHGNAIVVASAGLSAWDLWKRKYRLHQFFARTVGTLAQVAPIPTQLAVAFLHVWCGRFVLYERWLFKAKGLGTVLVADGRDVLFQDNPFLAPPDDVEIAEEDRPVLDGAINEAWLKEYQNGTELDSAWSGRPVLCAGVMLGPASKMFLFVRALNRSIRRAWPRMGPKGWDQIILNVKLRDPASDLKCEIHPHGKGPIFHVGDRWAEFSVVEGGVLRWISGEPIAVVHQYDRFPSLRLDGFWLDGARQ